MNHTLISLVTKVNLPKNMPQFSLISLCNIIYKFITKYTINRIKGIFNEVIVDSQSEFAPGRCIIDDTFIAFVTIHYMKIILKGKRYKVVVKLDMCKAYDTIKWWFVECIMRGWVLVKGWYNWYWIVLNLSPIHFWWIEFKLMSLSLRGFWGKGILSLHTSLFFVLKDSLVCLWKLRGKRLLRDGFGKKKS